MTELTMQTDIERKVFIKETFEGLKRDLIQDENACEDLLKMIQAATTPSLSVNETRGMKRRIGCTIQAFRNGFVDQVTCVALIEQLLSAATEHDVAFLKMAKVRSAA